MATTLSDQFAVSQDPEFQGRVRIALTKVALGIAQEDPATDNHALHMVLAARVMERLDWWTSQASTAMAALGLDLDTIDTDLLIATQQTVAAAAALRQAGNSVG